MSKDVTSHQVSSKRLISLESVEGYNWVFETAILPKFMIQFLGQSGPSFPLPSQQRQNHGDSNAREGAEPLLRLLGSAADTHREPAPGRKASLDGKPEAQGVKTHARLQSTRAGESHQTRGCTAREQAPRPGSRRPSSPAAWEPLPWPRTAVRAR